MRPATPFATLASGLRLHFRVQGQPGAPWLVLLNGLLSDATMWAGVLPHLSPRYRILTFDQRGQGRSDVPEGGPYPAAQLARDAWELLERLEIRDPWLLGLSNGSSVALELLTAHPAAFAGAVLTSSMAHVDFTTRLRVLHWVQCLEVGGPLMQFDAAAPYLWGDRFLERRHGVLRAYHQVTVAGSGPRNAPDAPGETQAGRMDRALRGALNQMRGILDWDIRSRLPLVKAPVLLLAGAEDLLTPPWKCLETAQGIPHCRFEIVPGIGHAYPVEAPKSYADRAHRFIQEIRDGASGLPA